MASGREGGQAIEVLLKSFQRDYKVDTSISKEENSAKRQREDMP